MLIPTAIYGYLIFGIYAMSIASGPMVYLSAILFAIGVMYFWPTMIGCIGEYLPNTGALGMSLIVLFAGLIVVMKKQGIKPVISDQAEMAKAAEMPQP